MGVSSSGEGDVRQVPSSRGQIRKTGGANRADRIQPSRGRPHVSQAHAHRREGPRELVLAIAAAPPVTVCLYFVVCF